MKKSIVTLLLFASLAAFGQKQTLSTRDSLKAYTLRLLDKALKKRDFNKIAIWDFTDSQNELSRQGTYIAQQVSIYASNIDSVRVLDRQNVPSILREHKMKHKDYLIDKDALLELGKFSGAEVLMVGKVIIFETECKIQLALSIVDANTAETLAADEAYLTVDQKFADVSGLTFNCYGTTSGKPGKGFTRPLVSNEQYNNNQQLIEDQCETKNKGIYCFFNNAAETMQVTFYTSDFQSVNMLLKPQESKCLYTLQPGQSYEFIVHVQNSRVYNENYDEGRILVEKCQSKTYTIRKALINGGTNIIREESKKAGQKGIEKGIEFLKKKLRINGF